MVVDGAGVVLTLSNSATYGNLPVYQFGNLIVTKGAAVVGLSQGSMSPYTITNQGVAIQSAGDVVIASGSSVNADYIGFAAGNGPGGTFVDWTGGTHGGCGDGNTNATYGSYNNPITLGSGGRSNRGQPSYGGGAIKLIVSGNLVVNGRLSANGQNDWDWASGGGAGGSIWITGGCMLGGTGEVQASGGSCSYPSQGGGGGGRIAMDDSVIYNFQGNIRGANGAQNATFGGVGSVYFPASARQNFTVFLNQTLVVGNDIENVFGNLTVYGTLVLGGNYAGQGSGAVIRATSATIAANGSINANAWGLYNGPGYLSGAGGTYGGVGEDGSNDFVYGSATTPTSMGSGGGGTYGATGGGAMKLIVSQQLDVLGSISADGQGSGYTGGSGGSIWIDTGTLVGNGTIHANGGISYNPDCGGGGRIAVYYHSASTFSGLPAPGLYTNLETISSTVTVKGGCNTGANGPEDGSIYIVHVVPLGTTIWFR